MATSAWKSRLTWPWTPKARSPRRGGCGGGRSTEHHDQGSGHEGRACRPSGQLIGEGINVNVTLLFGIEAYLAVAEAYMAGLEAFKAGGGDVAKVHGVASFFVSRIDGADRQEDRQAPGRGSAARRPQTLRGKVAIANAKIAYQHYLEMIATPRWKALAAAGAAPQRLLWASTGTKDPAYSRRPLRRHPGRGRHRQHHAAQDHGRLPRPRQGHAVADRRRRGRARGSRRSRAAGARSGRRHRRPGGGRGRPSSPRRSTAARRGGDQARRTCWAAGSTPSRSSSPDDLDAAAKAALDRPRPKAGPGGCGPATPRCGPAPTKPSGSAGSPRRGARRSISPPSRACAPR